MKITPAHWALFASFLSFSAVVDFLLRNRMTPQEPWMTKAGIAFGYFIVAGTWAGARWLRRRYSLTFRIERRG